MKLISITAKTKTDDAQVLVPINDTLVYIIQKGNKITITTTTPIGNVEHVLSFTGEQIAQARYASIKAYIASESNLGALNIDDCIGLNT